MLDFFPLSFLSTHWLTESGPETRGCRPRCLPHLLRILSLCGRCKRFAKFASEWITQAEDCASSLSLCGVSIFISCPITSEASLM